MINLLIDDELVRFSDEDLVYFYLGEGTESTVYKYYDEALKIYDKYCSKIRLDEKAVEILKKIDTKRILLPKRIIHNADSGEFLGYSTKRINPSSISGLARMKMGDFVKEIDIMQDDVRKLTDANVDLEDLNIENTIYNGNIYLVDPGSYVVRTLPGLIRFVSGNNRVTINNYVQKELFGLINTTRKEKDKLVEILENDLYISDFIKETAHENESVKQYVKRITR